MIPNRLFWMGFFTLLCFAFLSRPAATAQSVRENNEVLFEQLQRVHGLSGEQVDSIRALFRQSGYMGQGNPSVAKHPMTPDG